MAWLAEKSSCFPHEYFFNRRDVPGEYIPMAHIVIDMQCIEAYASICAEAAERARSQ